MIEIVILSAFLYLGYRIFKKPGEAGEAIAERNERAAERNERVARMNVQQSRKIKALVDLFEESYGYVFEKRVANMGIIRCNGNANSGSFNLWNLNRHLAPHK